ncbi:cadmium resistance transporter [Iningainema tapete]|uniref:Cadmium resistance transporter n=1 Tax=Iningainema tapete BLCC-T55 TaxID=2748662 RepID=A0A8J7BZE6_9CYAN|nr:cadmium resistance transporter [Iningainema tapete]MBD2777497.1 cadmium resistance transporter [Iningainema tapete BLCC-T55]
MSELYTAIPTGITAFAVTNLDDIVILSLLFSQVNALFRRHHIVMGQYLGFASLIVLSLPSFFGSLLIPPAWIGLLGILPIVIGINRWLNQDAEEAQVNTEEHSINWFTSFLSPQSYSVAAITIANGGDNVAIYAPLFATSTWFSLVVILAVFFSLVGVWCYAAYQLTRTSAIANILTTYGNQLVPFVLIGLGVVIMLKSHTLENPVLAVLSIVLSCFCLLAQNSHIWQTVK